MSTATRSASGSRARPRSASTATIRAASRSVVPGSSGLGNATVGKSGSGTSCSATVWTSPWPAEARRSARNAPPTPVHRGGGDADRGRRPGDPGEGQGPIGLPHLGRHRLHGRRCRPGAAAPRRPPPPRSRPPRGRRPAARSARRRPGRASGRCRRAGCGWRSPRSRPRSPGGGSRRPRRASAGRERQHDPDPVGGEHLGAVGCEGIGAVACVVRHHHAPLGGPRPRRSGTGRSRPPTGAPRGGSCTSAPPP